MLVAAVAMITMLVVMPLVNCMSTIILAMECMRALRTMEPQRSEKEGVIKMLLVRGYLGSQLLARTLALVVNHAAAYLISLQLAMVVAKVWHHAPRCQEQPS
jgi:hypothetical protein